MTAKVLPLVQERGLPEILAEKGYTLGEKIGEGNTRDVYLAEYVSGSVRKRRVVKIPKSVLDTDSLVTRINFAGGRDLDEREVMALNGISHPNLIEVYEALKIGARTATIEEYFDAVSLEELIRLSGPITNPQRFRHILGQVHAALEHLHQAKRVYHRDVKPSNILVGKGTRHVKVADLQNVGRIDDVEDGLLPTRGGTAYTDPHILNALLQGETTRYTLGSEFYSLGATMYFMLTGEHFSALQLRKDDASSRTITIDGVDVGFTLANGDVVVEQIDEHAHDVQLKQKLQTVPHRYRSLLFNCLSLEKPKYGVHTTAHHLFLEDLETATNGIPINWKKVGSYAAWGVGGAALLAGVIAGGMSASIQRNHERLNPPTVLEMLKSKDMPASGIEFVLDERNKDAVDALVPYFKEAKEKLAAAEEKHSEIFRKFPVGAGYITTGAETHRIPKRLAYSLIRSVAMGGEEGIRFVYGSSRSPESAVPFDFVRKVDGDNATRYHPAHPYDIQLEPHRAVGLGMFYLRQFITTDTPVPEVVAAYFENRWKLDMAKIRTQSDSVLPQCVEQNWGCKNNKGYGGELDPRVKDLIYRTLALYYITDETGKVHFEVLDSNNRPIKGLDAK